MWNSSPSATAAAAQSPSLSLLSLYCCCFCLALKCNRTESKLWRSLAQVWPRVSVVVQPTATDRLALTAQLCAGRSLAQRLRRFSCFRASDANGLFFVRSALSLCLRNNKNKFKQVARALCELSEKFWNICAKLWNTRNIKTQTYDECIKLANSNWKRNRRSVQKQTSNNK